MSADIFVARQPIFDTRNRVFGYELLFRSGPENYFKPTDADVASSTSIDRSVMSVGFEGLTQGRMAFVNVSRGVLLNEIYLLLPPERTVIELLESVPADEQVIAECKRLKERGYLLALDDFTGSGERFLEYADIAKIELASPVLDQTLEILEPFRARGLSIVAEKVETQEDLQRARNLSCSYFQGYYFCRPEMIRTKEVPSSKLNVLRFISEASRRDVSFERLEEIVRSEVSLSTRMLRYLNSAGFGWPYEVSTLGQALRLLGLVQLQKWATMMGVMSLASDRPPELLVTALARARFVEKVGSFNGHSGRELDLFLSGMLSLMDAMVGRPLPEVISDMAISAEVRQALLDGSSPIGDILRFVSAYERGDWQTVEPFVHDRGLVEDDVQEAYTSSLRWASDAISF